MIFRSSLIKVINGLCIASVKQIILRFHYPVKVNELSDRHDREITTSIISMEAKVLDDARSTHEKRIFVDIDGHHFKDKNHESTSKVTTTEYEETISEESSNR